MVGEATCSLLRIREGEPETAAVRVPRDVGIQAADNVPRSLEQHDLAISNLPRLGSSWWQAIMFATHPDPFWRIAQAGSLRWQQGKQHQ